MKRAVEWSSGLGRAGWHVWPALPLPSRVGLLTPPLGVIDVQQGVCSSLRRRLRLRLRMRLRRLHAALHAALHVGVLAAAAPATAVHKSAPARP